MLSWKFDVSCFSATYHFSCFLQFDWLIVYSSANKNYRFSVSGLPIFFNFFMQTQFYAKRVLNSKYYRLQHYVRKLHVQLPQKPVCKFLTFSLLLNDFSICKVCGLLKLQKKSFLRFLIWKIRYMLLTQKQQILIPQKKAHGVEEISFVFQFQ